MIRVLSIEEMLDQPEGAEAVLTRDYCTSPTTARKLYRERDVRDDEVSVLYCYVDSRGEKVWNFFEEGEVGVEETHTEQSVFKPDLENRKNGKILVNLFDQGFPNAIFEISKVMTWAGDVKGYKPHDWKNLPDAENALEGAASRHRMEHNRDRQAGAKLIDIVDHESKLLHKAHEAFNVLAELELIITQRIS